MSLSGKTKRQANDFILGVETFKKIYFKKHKFAA